MQKTRILWLSRHKLTQDQIDGLRSVYGEIEIKRCQRTVRNWREVREMGEDCDVLAVVLPIAILADLVGNVNKPVIRALTSRVPSGCTFMNAAGQEEIEYRFQHNGWEQVKAVQVETVKLNEREIAS